MIDLAAVAAGLIYAAAMVVLLVVQTWRHARRTGSTGFNGFRGRGLAARTAGVSFVLAVAAGLAAPLLTTAGVLPRLDLPVVLGAFGTVVAAAGLQLGFVGQHAMRESWRIGVDPEETTGLVTEGLFSVIRNPIFTALIMIQAGTAAMALNWMSLAGTLVMMVACQIQTRLVEEPYLTGRHGRSYLDYAARTGRFLPMVGRLTSTDDRHPRSDRGRRGLHSSKGR